MQYIKNYQNIICNSRKTGRKKKKCAENNNPKIININYGG